MIRTYFSHRRYFLSQFFVLMGIICIASVLISRESRNRAGGDTLWIIDNSLSMGVEDMRGDQGDTIESRLDAAKSLILSGSASMGGRHSLLTYARSAGILLPLSSERMALENSIENLSLVTDNGGSDISAAFLLLFSLYRDRSTPLHIILLSDGGDTSTTVLPPLPPQSDLTVIGIGTDAGGPISLGYDTLGKRRYKIYAGKELVVPYEGKYIDTIVAHYHANFSRMNTTGDTDTILAKWHPLEIHDDEDPLSIAIIFGSLLILIALFLPAYAQVKHV